MVLHIQSQLSEENKKISFDFVYVIKYTQDHCISAVCADTSQKLEEHSQLHFQFSFSSASEWVCSESFEEKEEKIYQKFLLCPLFHFLLQEEDERIPTHPFSQRTR